MTPADVKAWRAANEPEQRLTTEVIDALNASGWVHAIRVDSGGARQRNGQLAEPGTPDVVAYAIGDGIFVGVETKKNHPDGCNCPHCKAQRAWGARLVAAGGVYVDGVRNVEQALGGVKLGLVRVRGRRAEREEIATDG